MKVAFTLNSHAVAFQVEPGEVLLDLLRRESCLSVKRGCDTGDCGACVVLLDGRPVNSCSMLALQMEERSVETVECLSHGDILHPLQKVFLEQAAIQCGYCTPAMLLVTKSLLDREPNPTEARVREALAGVLCRCTAYVHPVRAVLSAAQELREVSHGR